MTDQHRRLVDARCERFVEESVALDPITATYVGVSGYDDRLPDLSPDGFAERERVTRAAYADVLALEPSDEREQVAKDAFTERVGLQLERAERRLDRSEFSVIVSGLHDLRSVFDLMPHDGEQAWSDISARLAAVPDTLAGYRTTLGEEAASGNVAARRQYHEVAQQVLGWTGQQGESGDFFAGLAGECEIEGTLHDDVAARAAQAKEAFADFGRFVSDELTPLGRERDGVGREEYRLGSRYFLGADVDLDETYAWGWAELHRLTEDMAATSARILPGATIEETIEHLDRDPARVIRGREAFREWMQDLTDRTIADMAGTHFDIPEPIRVMECCLAPTNDGGMYYTGPSEDFSRPGRMWWSVPDGIDDFQTWREVTTVFHEGVPGHHLQVAQTAYRADVLNRWQRLLCWVSGHGEGWALYAERLMEELGYLDDPADRLGMLAGQALRAARVIVDIGMHCELTIPADNPFGFAPGRTWTPELGLAFMQDHARLDDALVRFEVNRYLGWPGQAPSYKVGERIWLQARADAQARAGDAFDLRTFHRQALDLGSLGLEPLTAALARL